MHPIYELKSIANFAPKEIQEQIINWIDRCVVESHVEVFESHPMNKDHQDFQIENAKRKLGEGIANRSNMYPTFEKRGKDMVCRMSALHFKNEHGV